MTDSIRARCLCCTFTLAVLGHGVAPAAAQTTFVPQPAPQTPRAFSALFAETLSDFRNIGSSRNVTVLTMGALLAAGVHRVDAPMTRTLSSDRVDFLAAGETIGSARFQLATALATLAAGRVSGNGTIAALGADLVSANIVAQSMTAAIKLSARRGRPDGTEFSFPSGHTSTTFAAATVVQRHLGWKAGIPAYAVASYVAASRVHDRRHFLSDVAFGAVVGLVSGWSVTMGHDEAVTVTPVASAGGAGLSLTW